jgi:hypothetical protein
MDIAVINSLLRVILLSWLPITLSNRKAALDNCLCREYCGFDEEKLKALAELTGDKQ